MRTLSFINLKGGVGKTTIATNVAYALAESWDVKVLFIDNDKQGDASSWFNAHRDGTLTNILLDGNSAEEVIQRTRYPNIDILPSDMGLIDAQRAVIKNDTTRQDDILKKALAKVADKYDICIIDSPPDVNICVFNALVITDDVIIVTEPSLYSLDGVYKMADEIKKATRYNQKLNLCGVLLNKFQNTTTGYSCIDELEKHFSVFDTRIRMGRTTKDRLDSAVFKKKSIYETSPTCGFARDLIKFIEKLIQGE
jgi:chromosome partitioning protein